MAQYEASFKIGNGLTKVIRDAFWFEQRFDWALDTLKCFEGISDEQIDDILRGDAEIRQEGDVVQLVYEEDKEFKDELKNEVAFAKKEIERLNTEIYNLSVERDKDQYGTFSELTEKRNRITYEILKLEKKLNALQKMLEHYNRIFEQDAEPELTVNIGGYDVPKTLIDDYTNHILKRLRSVGIFHANNIDDILELRQLEERRREIHNKILEAVGLDKREGKKYHEFSVALEKYLEEHGAGLSKLTNSMGVKND